MTHIEQIATVTLDWLTRVYPHITATADGLDNYVTLHLATDNGVLVAALGVMEDASGCTVAAIDLRAVDSRQRRAAAGLCTNRRLYRGVKNTADVRGLQLPLFTGYIPLADPRSIDTITQFIDGVLAGPTND